MLGAASGETISQWNFNTTGLQAAPYNSPAPTIGAGTATALGMTNSYNGSAIRPVATLPLASRDRRLGFFGRHRGGSAAAGNNGWATTRRGTQYTQGIELDASTAGYQNIQFSFDWYCTAQGIRDLQFQYNTNVSNSAGWTNFGGTSPTGTYLAASNDFYNPSSPPGTITVDLSSISRGE